jgi:hypothetical protein
MPAPIMATDTGATKIDMKSDGIKKTDGAKKSDGVKKTDAKKMGGPKGPAKVPAKAGR